MEIEMVIIDDGDGSGEDEMHFRWILRWILRGG